MSLDQQFIFFKKALNRQTRLHLTVYVIYTTGKDIFEMISLVHSSDGKIANYLQKPEAIFWLVILEQISTDWNHFRKIVYGSAMFMTTEDFNSLHALEMIVTTRRMIIS